MAILFAVAVDDAGCRLDSAARFTQMASMEIDVMSARYHRLGIIFSLLGHVLYCEYHSDICGVAPNHERCAFLSLRAVRQIPGRFRRWYAHLHVLYLHTTCRSRPFFQRWFAPPQYL